jgi:hypothetical protein
MTLFRPAVRGSGGNIGNGAEHLDPDRLYVDGFSHFAGLDAAARQAVGR